jgi:hypothetical protein
MPDCIETSVTLAPTVSIGCVIGRTTSSARFFGALRRVVDRAGCDIAPAHAAGLGQSGGIEDRRRLRREPGGIEDRPIIVGRAAGLIADRATSRFVGRF